MGPPPQPGSERALRPGGSDVRRWRRKAPPARISLRSPCGPEGTGGPGASRPVLAKGPPHGPRILRPGAGRRTVPGNCAVRRRRARKGTPRRRCAEQGRERPEHRKEGKAMASARSASPGGPEAARAIAGATAARPTDKQDSTTRQAGKRRPAPGGKGAEGGARRRPGETRG